MNVLFLYSSTIDPMRGGIQRVTSVLASFFETRGLGVYFLSLKKTSEYAGTRQVYLPVSKTFHARENAAFFAAFLREKRIDVVINQEGISPGTSRFAFAARAAGARVISAAHNSLIGHIKNFPSAYADRFSAPPLRWLLPLADTAPGKKALLALYWLKYARHYRALCAKSDAVALLSETFKEELRFFTGKNARNVAAIPNPVSFLPGDEDAERGAKKKELLYVGRLDFSQKRVDLLLRIWEKLFREFPDWRLRVVGGGPRLPAARALAEHLGLERVSFEGFRDPRDYYRDAALFCMTSSYEGFGVVLVEAMGYGTVPFAFKSYPSVTDIIDDGVNGVLVTPFDTDEYARALRRFMADDTLREKFARSGREKAREFAPERVGEKWLELFAGVMT